MERLSSEALPVTLLPASQACLKSRADGTILDERHRIHILRRCGVEVDGLPREIVVEGQD